MGHEGDLRYTPGSLDRAKLAEAAAGSNMVPALGAAHGWLLDETKLLRLFELCVGPEQKNLALEYRRRWEQKPWTITFLPISPPSIRIMHYEEGSIESAKIKLSQFPRGSRYQWLRNTRRSDEEDRAIEELSTFCCYGRH
jgi:hypothetical protein